MIKVLYKNYVVIFLILLGCSQDNNQGFNFTFKKKDGLHDKILVEGNINESKVPNGIFKIYDLNGKVTSKGSYDNGYKSGYWNYFIRNLNDSLDWMRVDSSNYSLSFPADWQLKKKEDFILYAFESTDDSLVRSRFVIKEHDYLNKGAKNFPEYSDAFFGQYERNEYFTSKADYSQYFSENFAKNKFAFRNYVGKDSSGDPISGFFSLTLVPEKNVILEVTYIAPSVNGEFEYRIFCDILLDITFNDNSLFTKWGL